MVNLGESSKQLYHAIIELNQLIISPEIRLKLIEIIHEPIQQVCQSLTKHYLNQPVVLPPKARKVARLAMALDNHALVAYKVVLNDRKKLSQALFSNKPKKITALAIYRAMSIATRMIVRAYHLYNPAPKKVWHEIHQLYVLAESNHLLNAQIDDTNNHFVYKTNIEDAYKRALMIGCCKANQIRQNDISNIYHATELWTKLSRIVDGKQQANFIINLNEDSAPIYSELSSDINSPFSRGIDLQPLLELLKEYFKRSDSAHDAFVKGISVPSIINKHHISFLLASWETLAERSATRVPSDKSVKTCIGFRATHFYLSGGVDFETQLQRESSHAESVNKFSSQDVKPLVNPGDPWATAFDAEHDDTKPVDHRSVDIQKPGGAQLQHTIKLEENSSNHPQYTARLLDTSPNGYCIQWANNAPAGIKAGEIIGINEQDNHIWSVGVIRWISQPKADLTTMGVELLATAAISCGAKVISDSLPTSDYMRALLLPAQEALGQPATFIAPNMPFKEHQSVVLNQYGETSQGLLGACILNTGSFSQFTYEPQDLRSDLTDDNSDGEDIWPEI